MGSDYYFLDENCSFMLLKILEAIRPDLDLTSGFRLYAIPADTIRKVASVPGLLGEPSYLPASLAKFQQHTENLDAEERAELKRLHKTRSSDANCADPCKAKVLDALVQYVDFETLVVGSGENPELRKWRKELLLQRARVNVVSNPLVVRPRSSPPHLGHNASLIGVSAGVRQMAEDNTVQSVFTWRPALHDLTAGSDGYAPGMQLKVLETVASAGESARLESLTLLEIFSLPESVPLINTKAWRFGLGYERRGDFGSYYHQFGAGKAWWFQPERSALYGLLKSDLRFAADIKKLTLGPAVEVGALARIGGNLRVLVTGEGRRRFYVGGVAQDWLTRTAMTYTMSRIWDINCQTFADQLGYRTIALGVRGYY
jgi:hypothetical protein